MPAWKAKKVLVSDKMQPFYRYDLVEPVGKNFDRLFKPQLSPREMLELGVFGGRYMRDCAGEYPVSWFKKARLHPIGKKGHDPRLNYYGVDASQPLSVWLKKGWINESHDPRGWFQWYARYYLGRRLPEEDRRQIKRWLAMKRHIMQIKNNCRYKDENCRRRQRQAILHWAYDPRNI